MRPSRIIKKKMIAEYTHVPTEMGKSYRWFVIDKRPYNSIFQLFVLLRFNEFDVALKQLLESNHFFTVATRIFIKFLLVILLNFLHVMM